MARSGGARGAGDVGRDVVLVAVVVGGAVVRFWGLGAQSLWYDEWLTTEATSGGLLDLLRRVANHEGIPPPYFLVMWGWVRVFGDGEVALRSVSALAGVATIPIVYQVVRELRLPRRTARVAALLVAVNPMLVWYSQEVRPYSLLALVGAASLLTFARVWRRGGRRDWVGWSVVGAVAVTVHYIAVFLVLAEALVLLVALPRRVASPAEPRSTARPDGWRRVGLALVPTAMTLALLSPVAVRQHSDKTLRMWISAFPLPDRLVDAGQSALVGPSPPSGRLWLVAAAVALLAAILVVGACGAQRAATALMAAAGGGAVALPLVATAVGVDVVLSRYLIAALVPLLVAVAIGLTAGGTRGSATTGAASAVDGGGHAGSRLDVDVRRPAGSGVGDRPAVLGGNGGSSRRATTAAGWVGLVGVGVLVAVSLVALVAVARDPELQRAEWRQVASVVEPGDGEGVLVLNVHGTMASPLRHYLPSSRPLRPGETVGIETIDVVVAKPTDQPCNLLVGRGCGMVFLGAPPPDPLAAHLHLVDRVDLDQFRVDRYRTDEPMTVTREDLVSRSDRAGALILVL